MAANTKTQIDMKFRNPVYYAYYLDDEVVKYLDETHGDAYTTEIGDAIGVRDYDDVRMLVTILNWMYDGNRDFHILKLQTKVEWID